MQLFHVAHRAAATQQVTAQLFDELLEARLALRARRILMGFGHRRADGQVVADKQRQRLSGCSGHAQGARPAATGDPAAAMAASRWSPASGDSPGTPSATATIDDLDTPFLAASSSGAWRVRAG